MKLATCPKLKQSTFNCINYLPTYLLQFYPENLKIIINLEMIVCKDIA